MKRTKKEKRELLKETSAKVYKAEATKLNIGIIKLIEDCPLPLEMIMGILFTHLDFKSKQYTEMVFKIEKRRRKTDVTY